MESKITSWNLIEQKDFEQACVVADKEYLNTNSDSALAHKVLALLNLKRYEDSLKIALELIKITNGRRDSDYIDAGISYWMLEKYQDAIQVWKDGLKAQYTDAAGGVQIPAILFYASVVLKDNKLEKEAIKLLKKRYKTKAAVNFPGAIAGYLLEQITEEEFLDSYKSLPTLKERILCQVHFHIAVKKLKEQDMISFYNHLEKSRYFEAYLESEYYLAVGEIDKNINSKQ